MAAEARSAWDEGPSPAGVSPSVLSWHEADPTGLIYMRARYYDPAIGRFLSEDPLWSGNACRYADNDPVGSWDPFGWSTASEYGEYARKETQQSAARRKMAKEIACVITRNAVEIAMKSMAAEMVADALLQKECGGKCTKGGRITVIGLHDDYRFVTAALGAAESVFFDARLGNNPKRWWPPNKAWLRREVKAGSCIILTNPPSSASALGGFGRELRYLKELGFRGL